jgi:glycosyltransferase involved in cell wall biosynthesis
LQDLVEAAPMTLAALDGAIGAVLHNAAERDALAEQTHLPIYYLPLSCRFGPAPTRSPRHDPDAPSRLVMFGFIGENRRLLPILEVLAGMPDRERYRLDIYGIVEQEAEVDEMIATAGLGSLVMRHGFVPEPVLNTALGQADLALNLRWPSMGEASGAQLRIWAAKLPALVTRLGWYAQLPSDTVFMIDQPQEREQIVHHLRALRETPALYAQAGERGRAVLEQCHAPERYAKGLVAIAAERAVQHARRTGHALAERAAHLLLDLGPRELVRPLGGEVARCIADLTGA